MLKSTINENLKAAMKAGDTVTRDTLRMLDAQIKNEEISAGSREDGLDDAGVMTLIKRAIKQRTDAAAQYADAGRPELADTENSEIEVLAKYLPEQLSEDEVKKIVAGVIEEAGAQGPSDMGKVMGQAMAAVGDLSDGQTVKKAVMEILTAK